MKISFVKHGQEECDECEEFNLRDPQHSLSDSCTVCQEWLTHMRRAREAAGQQVLGHMSSNCAEGSDYILFSVSRHSLCVYSVLTTPGACTSNYWETTYLTRVQLAWNRLAVAGVKCLFGCMHRFEHRLVS